MKGTFEKRDERSISSSTTVAFSFTSLASSFRGVFSKNSEEPSELAASQLSSQLQEASFRSRTVSTKDLKLVINDLIKSGIFTREEIEAQQAILTKIKKRQEETIEEESILEVEEDCDNFESRPIAARERKNSILTLEEQQQLLEAIEKSKIETGRQYDISFNVADNSIQSHLLRKAAERSDLHYLTVVEEELLQRAINKSKVTT